MSSSAIPDRKTQDSARTPRFSALPLPAVAFFVLALVFCIISLKLRHDARILHRSATAAQADLAALAPDLARRAEYDRRLDDAAQLARNLPDTEKLRDLAQTATVAENTPPVRLNPSGLFQHRVSVSFTSVAPERLSAFLETAHKNDFRLLSAELDPVSKNALKASLQFQFFNRSENN